MHNYFKKIGIAFLGWYFYAIIEAVILIPIVLLELELIAHRLSNFGATLQGTIGFAIIAAIVFCYIQKKWNPTKDIFATFRMVVYTWIISKMIWFIAILLFIISMMFGVTTL